jgi:hypothetical protein
MWVYVCAAVCAPGGALYSSKSWVSELSAAVPGGAFDAVLDGAGARGARCLWVWLCVCV